MAEQKLCRKDRMIFHCLNAVTNGSDSMKIYLESDGAEKDITEIRSQGSGSYRYNNFLITEDKQNDTIIFTPNVVGCRMYFAITSGTTVNCEVIRAGETDKAFGFALGSGKSQIDMTPEGMKDYVISVTTQRTEPDAAEVITAAVKPSPAPSAQARPQPAQPDQDRLEDAAERLKTDRAILERYESEDPEGIGELLQKADTDIRMLEDAIREHVTAHEKKTEEIEQELKVGKH